MSALGQKRTLAANRSMSALPPKADINGRSFDVCFVPEADIQEREPLFGVLRASSLLSSWAADRHPGSAHPRNRHSRAPGRWSRTTKQASSSSTGQAAGRGEVALLDNARNCYLRTKGALTPAGQTKPLALQQYGRPCCNRVLVGVVLSLEEGDATTRFHQIICWISRRVAARGSCATASDAGRWICSRRIDRCLPYGSVPQGPKRNRLRRRPECNSRVSLAGGPVRSPASAPGRPSSPPGGRDCHAWHRSHGRGQSGNSDDPHRLQRRRGSGPAWSCRKPRATWRQRDRDQLFRRGGDRQAAAAPA